MIDLDRLQELLGHRFADRQLLMRAITHRSYANERGGGVGDNEVLEFLGDAVLGLIVTDILFRRYPSLSEGEMSKLKSFLVSAETLAELAERRDLGSYMLLGRGEEKTAGRAKNSILANTFEAVVGALYVDGGLEQARQFVLAGIRPLLGEHSESAAVARDYKSVLQERVQADGPTLPTYRIVDEEGPDHDKVFHVEVSLTGGKARALGSGSTKKRAEQGAAKAALESLDKEGD